VVVASVVEEIVRREVVAATANFILVGWVG